MHVDWIKASRNTQFDFENNLQTVAIQLHGLCVNMEQGFCCSRCIDKVTLKTIYFHYLIECLSKQSIQKHSIWFWKQSPNSDDTTPWFVCEYGAGILL